MAMFDATRADFRANIEVLEWQQKQQMNKEIGEHSNIGFKDFVTVKAQYHKEQTKKKTARARASRPREGLRQAHTIQMHSTASKVASLTSRVSPESQKSEPRSGPSPVDSKLPVGSPLRERLPILQSSTRSPVVMENEEPTQVTQYIQKQLALNKERLAKQDSSFTVTSRLC